MMIANYFFMEKVFPIIFFIIFFGTLFLIIAIAFSSKFRSKILANQMKSIKGMTDLSKEDIEKMMTNLSEATIKSRKKVLDDNESNLKDIADAEARINKDAIKETSRAVKEGFTDSETKFCKYCGSLIDDDSVFCKNCGKKQ